MTATARHIVAAVVACSVGLTAVVTAIDVQDDGRPAGLPDVPGRFPNSLTAPEKEAGWKLLFDGRTTNGWRGFKQESMPDGWQVQDGTLARVSGGGDIVTVKEYENFDLRLEWKVAPGGNSGIFWRVSEDRNYVWETAPEMQILDDDAHRDGLSPTTSAGADYALYAPKVDAAKPAGEWNSVRIRVDGANVTYWMNDKKIVEYELWSEEWEKRVGESKFADLDGFGRNTKGHIALQDHGDAVWFRNIRILELPSTAKDDANDGDDG